MYVFNPILNFELCLLFGLHPLFYLEDAYMI